MRERERESEQAGRGRKRGRERIPSRLCIVSEEPNMGLILINHEIMIWAKTKSQLLNQLSHTEGSIRWFLDEHRLRTTGIGNRILLFRDIWIIKFNYLTWRQDISKPFMWTEQTRLNKAKRAINKWCSLLHLSLSSSYLY